MESRMYAELSTESRSYSSSKALTPVSSSSVVTFLVLLLGPGLLATHSWWTRRKEQE